MGGTLIQTVVAYPRRVGDSFDALPDAKIIVNARAEMVGDDIHFAGVVVAVSERHRDRKEPEALSRNQV